MSTSMTTESRIDMSLDELIASKKSAAKTQEKAKAKKAAAAPTASTAPKNSSAKKATHAGSTRPKHNLQTTAAAANTSNNNKKKGQPIARQTQGINKHPHAKPIVASTAAGKKTGKAQLSSKLSSRLGHDAQFQKRLAQAQTSSSNARLDKINARRGIQPPQASALSFTVDIKNAPKPGKMPVFPGQEHAKHKPKAAEFNPYLTAFPANAENTTSTKTAKHTSHPSHNQQQQQQQQQQQHHQGQSTPNGNKHARARSAGQERKHQPKPELVEVEIVNERYRGGIPSAQGPRPGSSTMPTQQLPWGSAMSAPTTRQPGMYIPNPISPVADPYHRGAYAQGVPRYAGQPQQPQPIYQHLPHPQQQVAMQPGAMPMRYY